MILVSLLKMHIKLYLLILSALILATHASPLLSQTESVLSDVVLALADRSLELGNYDEAVTEYKRFIFFNPKDDHTSYALYRMGLAYRAGYNWQEAVDVFRASILATKNSRIADERRIVLATTLIASGNSNLARLELLRVSELSNNPSLRLKSLYFGGIASLYMFDWGAARESFGGFYSEYAEGRMMERAEKIDSILLKTRRSYKSTGLAKFLSTIFPGLGQIYAGDWRDGLNALALNGIVIGFIANAIYRKEYRNAALISSISIRYYLGNIYRAEVDVREHNESLDRRGAARILELVLADEPT